MLRTSPERTLQLTTSTRMDSMLARPRAKTRSDRHGAGRRARKARTTTSQVAPAAGRRASKQQPLPHLDLDTIATQWQRALDAGERALRAAAGTLPAGYLSQSHGELARERQQTAEMLIAVARVSGMRPAPWLSPVRITADMLGLPPTASACLFDLDGVLTDSAFLHAWAWGEVFDAFLLRLSEDTGWQFMPFDRRADYRTYIDGRSRLEGVHAFLDSRGIRLPEGRPDDLTQADTAWGLAKRKGEALVHGLQLRGVTALPGVRRYLTAAGHAGLKRATISASASTLPMLELATLSSLVEARVDADVIRAEGIRTPPAPDLLLAACRLLDVRPERAVSFAHSPAGVAAGLTAGVTVIGIGVGEDEDLLRGFGAPRVVPSLHALLDPRVGNDASADDRR